MVNPVQFLLRKLGVSLHPTVVDDCNLPLQKALLESIAELKAWQEDGVKKKKVTKRQTSNQNVVRRELESRGFIPRATPEDGHCLYWAVLHFLPPEANVTVNELRHTVIANASTILQQLGIADEEFISVIIEAARLGLDTDDAPHAAWGEDATLAVLAYSLDMRIESFSEDTGASQVHNPAGRRQAYILHRAWGHYEILEPSAEIWGSQPLPNVGQGSGASQSNSVPHFWSATPDTVGASPKKIAKMSHVPEQGSSASQSKALPHFWSATPDTVGASPKKMPKIIELNERTDKRMIEIEYNDGPSQPTRSGTVEDSKQQGGSSSNNELSTPKIIDLSNWDEKLHKSPMSKNDTKDHGNDAQNGMDIAESSSSTDDPKKIKKMNKEKKKDTKKLIKKTKKEVKKTKKK